jgi:RNA polymerase sigma-70 factor (ECF subfamily)
MGSDDDFYEAYLLPVENRMLRTAWRITRGRERARDALQEAMVRVWSQRDRIRAHPRPQALILRMCIDAAIDSLRKEGKHQRWRVDYEVEVAVAPAAGNSANVLAAIGRLAAKQAAAVYLRLVEEKDYAEIAVALECSEATARVHVMRGRVHLQEILAARGGAGER